MPKIIWCGNKSWDTDFPENTLPNNAKRIERPDNIFKSSLLYGILPLIFSYAIICIKWFMIGENLFKKVCCFCSMSRTNQQTSFYNNEFNAYAFRHNTFGYISFVSIQSSSFGSMYSDGDYWYAFPDARLYGCPHYLQTST